MILESLVSQIDQRFQYEKRAQVCLWFDEKQEFAALLPALRAHLSATSPAPFTLLEYDPSRNQGQIWLKYRVHRELAQLEPKQQQRRRFLFYLPLSEDRLDGPDPVGEHHLDLLTEYRITGVLWRIGGKRPTMFSFLRQAGVELPSSPSDQRKLYEGGPDSLLSKYVANFVGQPAAFWAQLLTPELAQSRLLGDVDSTILDLAMAPDTTWQTLQQTGLDREFLDAVGQRYGFSHPMESPAAWIEEFVAVSALTETFQGYDEPDDFPFRERLPAVPSWAPYLDLMRRWLRDSEARVAWDHWIGRVEKRIDLSNWASKRTGLSFGFPHLVKQRWEQLWEAFERSAAKTSTLEAFFEANRGTIKLEAEFNRSSVQPAGAWSLLERLENFIEACRLGEHRAAGAEEVGELARLYIENAGRIEREHVVVRREADEGELPAVGRAADRHYASYTNAINGKFFKRLARQQDAEIDCVPGVTEKLEEDLWRSQGRRAVIIVDALRYDCGLAVRDALQGYEVTVEPMRSVLPAITPIGMTALLPLSSSSVSLEIKRNYPHPIVDGKDCSQRNNRLAILTDFGADCREIEWLEDHSERPGEVGDLLVIFGHDDVDHIGHGSADKLIRHLEIEIARLARLVRKLHRWGYERVHVITDHGFILLEEAKLPETVPCDKKWCRLLKERYALVDASADIPLASFPFEWDPRLRVAVPPGLAFFKAEKSFSHGGAALQELVIPHLVSRSGNQPTKRVGVEVDVPTTELMQAAVKVVLRPVSTRGERQMPLFAGTGRTLTLDVVRASGEQVSILASRTPKSVRLEPTGDQRATLFFHNALTFRAGEVLELKIRDAETEEQFPPEGIRLTVGRDM